MKPETKKQHLANIKAAIIELHEQCGNKWISNKEFPLSWLSNKYLKSNSALRSYFVKYAVNELLKTEDGGRSYKFTWRDREHLLDVDYYSQKILSTFIENNREKVSPLPKGNFRKLEVHGDRVFNLRGRVFIIDHLGVVCEGVISGKLLNIMEFGDQSPIIYNVVYNTTHNGMAEVAKNSKEIFLTLNEVFDYLRINIRKFT